MDIGFWELLIIVVVALLVIGPERLPEVARTTGRWVGRIRAYANNVKSDIDRELRFQELQDMMRSNERDGLHEISEIGKEISDKLAIPTESLTEDLDFPEPTKSTANASKSLSQKETKNV
ncbi:Sec-independent protein translocase protein TatB [Candidatus Venteria ishoeyi]|uniref:Sec-independent protein translocase protein TatB n=1 Tax=Candidatus Venteria ishoeyi TaxID=1899563 RepID=A0A1H6FFD3_9GAMM|nr:Sec-independent protein translocase protein TatB [Candidatus Venteria ishoeyi]MDM8547912.1 Sec-independent protein translocase protein TatB [Candidatus Venteria ishoeyi]SEH08772.1 Sec-independent protein translocase protein TatB [Candidatus Venteria ishoeyi]